MSLWVSSGEDERKGNNGGLVRVATSKEWKGKNQGSGKVFGRQAVCPELESDFSRCSCHRV